MSKLKTYNKYFLKGSSLIESVIAITIIAVCLLIGIRMYAAILNTTDSIETYRMKFKVAQLYQETKTAKKFDDELFDFKTFLVRKRVSDFQGSTSVKRVRFSVETKKDTVFYNYLVKNNNE